MKTILLIEDNPDIRENTCELLELDGYEVLAVDSGEEGLRLAKEKLPGLIICDIVMRGMDGYGVLKEIRQHKETAAIPVIFLTASPKPKEDDSGILLGFTAFIRKPFSEEDLLESISNCLQEGQGR